MPVQSTDRGFIYLASRSPRRRELLAQLGLDFEVVMAETDESAVPDESAEDHVMRIALVKAREIWPTRDRLPVLAADTIVVAGERLLGKPRNRDDALAMLELLSGKSHWVHTGVACLSENDEAVTISSTEVRFREISLVERERYWDTGEPADKAGAYAIQGLAALFIETISGSYSGVMGLPLFETARLLQRFGYQFLD